MAVISLISAHSQDVHHALAFISRALTPTQAQSVLSTSRNKVKKADSVQKDSEQHCKALHHSVPHSVLVPIITTKKEAISQEAISHASRLTANTHSSRVVTVAHSRVVTVAHSRAVMVAHSRVVTVAHSRAVTVAHNRAVTVAHSRAVTVARSRAVTVAHSRAVTVVRSRAVTVVHSRVVMVVHSRAVTVVRSRASASIPLATIQMQNIA